MESRTASNSIEIFLPITTPTGKARVKRPRPGFVSDPVACRSRPMLAGDYLEWQISYDTDNLHDPSVVREVVLQKDVGTRYGSELVRLIVEARRLRLLPEARWQELRALIATRIGTDGIEERERIAVAAAAQTDDPVQSTFGFHRFLHHVPDYLKSGTRYAVEIKIGAKQRAVGTQAMIYVHLPLDVCVGENGRPLAGRTAEKSEKAAYVIDSANAALITDTTLAFILASRDHAHDIQLIFDALGL